MKDCKKFKNFKMKVPDIDILFLRQSSNKIYMTHIKLEYEFPDSNKKKYFPP